MHETPDLSRFVKIANSSSGQQLLELIKRSGGKELRIAMAMAAAGDYSQAQTVLAPLLSTPEAKKLLAELEENR